MEHRCVMNLPRSLLGTVRTPHKNGQLAVNSRCEGRVTASAENRRRSCIWIDQRKIGSGQYEAAIIRCLVRRIAKEERTIGSLDTALGAATNEGAKFEST